MSCKPKRVCRTEYFCDGYACVDYQVCSEQVECDDKLRTCTLVCS